MELPIKPGCRVELFTDIDVDGSEGYSSSIMFSDYVERYVQETGKISFAESDIGLAEFEELVEQCDGYEVLNDYGSA